MKILRLSAAALAAVAGCAIGCGGSSCGGTNVSNSNTPIISCDPNTTTQQNGVCVPTNQTNTQ